MKELLPAAATKAVAGGSVEQALADGERGGHRGLDCIVQGLPRKAHRNQPRVPHTLEVLNGPHKPTTIPGLAAQGGVI